MIFGTSKTIEGNETFGNQAEDHKKKIVSAEPKSPARKKALQGGIGWAGDALERLEDARRQIVQEFRRRKADWKRPVDDDEKPHVVSEQTHVAQTYRSSGLLAIAIETGIAAVILFFLLLRFGLAGPVTFALALIGAAIPTIILALVFHGGITFLVKRWGEPVTSLERVKKWFIIPSSILMLFAVCAYVAIQRLDAVSILALEPVLSATKFTAMLGFVFLGAALLVASDLLFWSRSRAASYEAILDKRQIVSSLQREWQIELDASDNRLKEPQPSTLAAPSQVAFGKAASPAELQNPDAPTAGGTPEESEPKGLNTHSSNGASGNAQTAAKVVAVVLAAVVLMGQAACGPEPAVAMQPVDGCNVSLLLATDASGVTNSTAMQQTGLNIRKNLQSIIMQQCVGKLRVEWWGRNGLAATEKLNIDIPHREKAVVEKQAESDLEKARPDIGEKRREIEDDAKSMAQAHADKMYSKGVQEALAPLTQEILIPSPDVQSSCTDLNGYLKRIANPAMVSASNIVFLITDARQNCGGNQNINAIAKPIAKVILVIVIVPGTEDAGWDDFEARSASLSKACPWATIIPYYREDLDQIVADTMNKRQEGVVTASK